MTAYIDLFGTESFYENYSEADLSNHVDWLENNIFDQFNNDIQEDVMVSSFPDHKVSVSTESNENDRLIEIDSWLRNNFSGYDLSAFCMVADDIDQEGWLGGKVLSICGAGEKYSKVGWANYHWGIDKKRFAHEIGHGFCGIHEASIYDTINEEGSLMWQPPNDNGPQQCNNNADPDWQNLAWTVEISTNDECEIENNKPKMSDKFGEFS